MQKKDWFEAGEDILKSVLNAVESQDYSGLSKNIEDKINDTIGQINIKVNDVNKKYAFNSMKSSTYGNKNTAFASVEPVKKQQPVVQKQIPQLYAKNPPGTYSGTICKVLGIVGTSLTGTAALVLTIVALATGAWGVWFTDVLVGGCLAGSIATLRHGVKTEGLVSRFKKYVARIGNTQYCEIEQLARIVDKKPAFVEKDVRKMIDKGYFLQGHLDDNSTTLITSDFMYKQYLDAEQSRRTREIEAAKEAKLLEAKRAQEGTRVYSEKVQSILDEGNQYIQHIHECNDAIPGEEMSEKLATLEDIMKRIFEQLKKNPESADDLQKMMKYYLPTTRKLIDAYRDMDGQPSYGDNNIANTKKEIEATLDVINDAFGKIFDDMFEDAAWDISTEISTMKTMLAKEGLTGEKDFQI